MVSSLLCPIFLLNIFLFLSCGVDGGLHWDYVGEHGVAQWASHFPENCAGKRQSPVDITGTFLNNSMGNINFFNYKGTPQKAEIFNNGHTVQLTAKDFKGRISGGCMKENIYQFEQLHFHWGSGDQNGSEHLFQGRAFPLEIHFVHRNIIYPDLIKALENEDGLAVIGVFFKVTSSDNDHLDSIVDALDDIKYINQKEKVKANKDFSLEKLLSKELSKYVCYQGSLTTPTCDEAVTWTVFPEPISIGKDQLKAFRKVHTGEDSHTRLMVDNFRPVQPLNGRHIFLYDSSSTSALSSVLLILSILALFYQRSS